MSKDDYIEFQKCLDFISKLKKCETSGQDAYPFWYIYDDEFRLLEKFVRRGYYGKGCH